MRTLGANLEILAAVAAVALLLVLVFALKVALLVSIVAAVLVFIGLYIVVHRPGALEQCEAKVRQMQRIAAEATRLKPPVGRQMDDICELERKILLAIREDEERGYQAQLFLATFLNPYYEVWKKYIRLAPLGLDTARDQIARTESETLPEMQANLKKFYEKLLSDDLVDLEVARDMASLSTSI